MLFVVAPLLSVAIQEPQFSIYSDRDINLSFRYPKEWKQTARDRRKTVLQIPGSSVDQSGQLELIKALYRGDSTGWQELQKTTFDLQKRTITRQWQLEIMGAPLLLTQTEFTERNVAMTQVSGLFYTRSASKLLFHLKSPSSGFDAVWFAWQKTIESFSTLDGAPLQPEDPSKPPAEPAKVDTRPARRVLDDGRTGGLPRGMSRLGTLRVGETVLVLEGQNGWKLVQGESPQTAVFKHRSYPEVKVEARFLLESTEAAKKMLENASSRLTNFEKIALREDVDITDTPQGTNVASVLRQGTRASGEKLLTFDAFLKAQAHYLIFSCESTQANRWKNFGRDVKLLLTTMRMSASNPSTTDPIPPKGA
jgi:hypothetical protein